MKRRDVRGFTLIEVVLAIAVGLIIIAGVSVGYTYAKRAAILDNQRKNVGAIKTWVEQAIASLQANMASGDAINPNTGEPTLVPPRITTEQMTALADRLPSLKFDPYTGAERNNPGCPLGVGGSCYGAVGVMAQDVNWGPSVVDNAPELGITSWPPGSGSAVGYVPGDVFQRKFTITLADGSIRTFYGYVILETDTDGNIVAADGGDTTTQQIGSPPVMAM